MRRATSSHAHCLQGPRSQQLTFTLDLTQTLRHHAQLVDRELGVLSLSWVLSAGRLFSTCMTESTFEDEWERVLWKKKPYPDNYVPKTFLSSLSKNRSSPRLSVYPCDSDVASCDIANFRPYSYWTLVQYSFAVTQHLASIVIFVAIFVHLNERRLDPRALIWASIGAFLAGWSVWEFLDCCSNVEACRSVPASTTRACSTPATA